MNIAKGLNRIISGLLVAVLILSTLTTTAFADYNGDGGGSAGGSEGGGLSWNTAKQGYRISVVDSAGNMVSAPVDLVYSAVPTNALGFYNSKVEEFMERKTQSVGIPISDMMASEGFKGVSTMPPAMDWKTVDSIGTQGPVGQGKELRQWLRGNEDKNIKALLNYEAKGQYVISLTGEDNSVATGTGRSAIIAEKDYRVLIEPILWFTPISKDGQAYSKVVYGTITNHAQWSQYMLKVGFDDNGIYKYMAITRMVGGWSLYVENDEVFTGRTIKSPEGSFNNIIKTSDLASNDIGYSLHTYKAEQITGGSGTRTKDDSEGNKPHKAPDPEKIKLEDGEKKEDRKINIVKTYQDNGSHVESLYRTQNPATIQIMDEQDYKVEKWFISSTYINGNASTTWKEMTSKAPVTGVSGSTTSTVKVDKPNTTLYVLLVKKSETEAAKGDLVIRESQITKAVDTMNPNVAGWGPKLMTFNAPSLTGTCDYTWETSSSSTDPITGEVSHSSTTHTCGNAYSLSDKAWDYNHTNTLGLEATIQTDVGAFKPINAKGADATGSRKGLGAETHGVNSFNFQQSIWRGKDIPTIAGYKETSGNPLNALLNRYGKQPAGERFTGGASYTQSIAMKLGMDSIGDYITTSKCPSHGNGKSADHASSDLLDYSGNVLVESFWSKAKKAGTLTGTPVNSFPTMAGKEPPTVSGGGQMIQNQIPIKWYPYVRMTYQTPGQADANRTNVNVLSQWLSEIVPNDYAEAAWVSDTDENLEMLSQQWSVHARATSGDKGWNQFNTVLPGGAIYQLNTKKSNTWASVTSYQPYLEDEIINNVVLSGQDYSYGRTRQPHDELAAMAELALENWRIVQFVETNTSKKTALNGLLVSGGGQSLSALGLPNKSSTEDKYYMKPADYNGKSIPASEGDLDIIKKETIEIKYKVTADVEGNIHVFRMNTGKNWVEVDKLSKTQNASFLKAPDVVKLNDRTKVVDNLITALNRNQGQDKTASWATSDGTWYNEAFDGICYVRYETCFTLELMQPNMRMAVIDPALCPANYGISDLFSEANISQMAMNTKSDQYTAEQAGFIGKFKGKDIILPGATQMFKTRLFAIPNVNVQDLGR